MKVSIRAAIGLLLVIVVLFLSGCISSVSPIQVPLESKVLAKIQRSGCQGACAIFALTIFFDGSATFRGEENTVVSGDKHFSLTKDQLAEIRSLFTSKGFLIINDRCCECVDIIGTSSTRITYQGNGPHKSINRYHGCLNRWSRNLENLEKEVLKIAGISSWVAPFK